MRDDRKGLRIRILVTPNFNMAATMNFVDPFRAANYLDGMGRFRWEFVSDGGGSCRASNGAQIETRALSTPDPWPENILVASSSWTPEKFATPGVLAALRAAARHN
ncbi:GlxA family transcriptional regulator, partial [Cribrihabitans sp. XS_ASV171]